MEIQASFMFSKKTFLFRIRENESNSSFKLIICVIKRHIKMV